MLPLWTSVTERRSFALVDERDGAAVVVDGVAQRGADEALGALERDGLDADRGGLREADLLHAHLRAEPLHDLRGLGRAVLPLDAGVDVLGVLAEDHHVGVLWMLHRRGDALEPAHGAEADVEVELLAEGDVERADAAADGRGERSLDGDELGADRVDRLGRQPGVRPVDGVGLLAGVDLHPGHAAVTAVGLGDGGVPDRHRRAGDVGSCAVALDEGDDGVVRDLESAVGSHADVGAVRRARNLFV